MVTLRVRVWIEIVSELSWNGSHQPVTLRVRVWIEIYPGGNHGQCLMSPSA